VRLSIGCQPSPASQEKWVHGKKRRQGTGWLFVSTVFVRRALCKSWGGHRPVVKALPPGGPAAQRDLHQALLLFPYPASLVAARKSCYKGSYWLRVVWEDKSLCVSLWMTSQTDPFRWLQGRFWMGTRLVWHGSQNFRLLAVCWTVGWELMLLFFP
jgi:hypothetical protein